MALNFPSSPVLNQVYQRWTWNGTAWVPTPTVSHPMLPISGGVVTGNLGVQGTTSLDGTLTAAGMSNLNTLQVNGAADFLDGVTLDGVDSADLATKTYVDEAVASGGLWQGTWDASANNPDLTDPDLHMNGWGWTIVTPDPTAPFDIPATPAIPGVSGVTVYNGDHVIWSATAAAFEIVHGSSLSLQEAQDMFLSLDNGGTVAGNTSFTGDVTIPAAGTLTVNGGLTVKGPFVHSPAVGAVDITQAGAGSGYNVPRVFVIPVDFATQDIGVFNLVSSDLQTMFYTLQFNLSNLVPGTRKEALLNLSRLYRPYFYAHPSVQGNNREFSFYSACGIFEAGVSNYGWIGRDQPAQTDMWPDSNSGMARLISESFRNWRNRFYQLGATPGNSPITANEFRNTIFRQGAFSGTFDQIRYRNMSNTYRHWGYYPGTPPTLIHVRFDYYSPNVKTLAFTPYYRTPRGDT